MINKMRAVVAHGPNDVRVETVEVPTPEANEVLVRVHATGVCATDLHIAEGDYQPISYPVILGHEFVGTVVAVGAHATSLSIGDIVAVDPSLYCGSCEYCRTGRDNLCTNGGGLGSTGPGAAAESVAVDAARCFPVPAGLSLDHAALIEPLACVVHGFELLPRRTGANYLIYGAGTMGLLVTAVAKASGAGSVTVIDLDESRLATAKLMGATQTGTDVNDFARAESGWDIAIDCTGAPRAIAAAIDALRRGGVFLQFGVAPVDATVPVSPFRLYKEEITLLGSRAVLNNFDAALSFLSGSNIDLEPLISARVSLDGFVGALDAIRSGGAGKTLVFPGQP